MIMLLMTKISMYPQDLKTKKKPSHSNKNGFVYNFVLHSFFLNQSVWLPELKREPFLIFLIAIMTCETSAKSLQIIIAIMQQLLCH